MWAKLQYTMLLGLLALGAGAAAAQPIIITPNGGPSLAETIRRADDHAVIRLQPGRYAERNIVVDRPLTIEGTEREGAVIDAGGKGFGLIIRADSVTVRDLEVHGTGVSFMDDNAGILVEKAADVLIDRVRLTDNFFGIYLSEASGIVIRNSSLSASGTRETQSGNGIHLWYSKDVTLENNRVRGHRDGIYFEFVENVTSRNNLSEENLRYGQHFMFSDRCTFSGNTFRNNGAGVAVMYTSHVSMTGNRFLDNWGSAAYGLLMKEIRQSDVSGNTFAGNSIALYMEASSRNRIKRNTFENNGWAVKVMANSMDNQFVKNNFIDNSFEVATNSRQNFNIFKQNYWSRYEGYDLDRDGTGDVPHHPVRLFSVLVEKQPQMLMLMRSLLIGILDTAERIMPVLTPEALVDKQPQMARIQ